MFQNLVNSPLFKGLSAEEVDGLFLPLKYQVKHFRSGEMLAQAGEEVDKAMLLLEGRLQGEMVDFAGNSLKIEEMDPPQMVAAAFLFGPASTFPVFLSAKSDGKILILPKKEFTTMLCLEPRVMVNYLNIVSGKAQFLTGKITFLSLKTIREKVAYYLMQRMRNGESSIVRIAASQTNLADLFGVTRPSLSRTILDLEKQGILTWAKETVTIHSYKKLNQILGRDSNDAT